MEDKLLISGIILGNGFDLAYNYNTGYDHFIESEQFKSLLDKGNSLAKHIEKVKTIQKWVDVEVEISNYSYSMERIMNPIEFMDKTKIFKSEFFALRNALSVFISSQTSSLSNKKMDKLVFSWFESAIVDKNRKIFIATFNYHQSDIVNTMNKYKNYIYEKYPVQIHGQADFYADKPCNIVLGIDEKNKRASEHGFIVKAFDENTNAVKFFRTIPICDRYIIFGCSIGITDLRYFKPLFSQKGKKYDIYGFREKGLIEIKSRIADICDYDTFISDNEVRFINSEIYSNRE